jgi:hypothetical protein
VDGVHCCHVIQAPRFRAVVSPVPFVPLSAQRACEQAPWRARGGGPGELRVVPEGRGTSLGSDVRPREATATMDAEAHERALTALFMELKCVPGEAGASGVHGGAHWWSPALPGRAQATSPVVAALPRI